MEGRRREEDGERERESERQRDGRRKERERKGGREEGRGPAPSEAVRDLQGEESQRHGLWSPDQENEQKLGRGMFGS